MNRLKALGIAWNVDPFPRYGPTDFPIIPPVVPPIVTPAYNYPVITEVQTVAPPAPVAVPNWVWFGGALLGGVVLAKLLRS